MPNDQTMVEITRSGITESTHRGHAIIVRNGKRVTSIGDPEKIVPVRSTAKPFQLAPLLEHGGHITFDLSEEEIAVLVSSHNGEERHVSVIRRILKKGNLHENDLECGRHLPYTLALVEKIYASSSGISPIHNNCSGKHTGILLLCRLEGFSSENYWRPDHPVQTMIIEYVSRAFGIEEPELMLLVDGCGLPTFGIPLYRLADAYYRLSVAIKEGSPESLSLIARAMIGNPFMVGGTGRAETRIMEVCGVLAKSGADGVFCLAVPALDIGVAVKMESGDELASETVAIEILRQLEIVEGLALEELKEYLYCPVRTHTNRIVGNYQPTFTIDTTEF